MMAMNDQQFEASWENRARRMARGIRVRVLEHTLKSNGGYLSQACSAAELFSVLYTKVMNLGPSQAPAVPVPFNMVPGPNNPHPIRGADYNGPAAPAYDRFFVSPGHYALVEYAALIEAGRMAPEGLRAFNQDGSTVEMIGADHSPGFEVMSGSLAQALSIAGGVALSRKLRGEPGKVWVFMSDGEFQEGQTWEALSSLAYYRLDNVGIFIDANGQQCDGTMDSVMNIEPLRSRLESFGAVVREIDGHDLRAIAGAAGLIGQGKPLAVICRTNPTQGIEILDQRRPSLHYLRFKTEAELQSYRAVYQQMTGATAGEER